MVLGISLRSRKKKDEPTIPASPSLPSVLPQGIPWPENLVDINDVRAAREEQKSPAPSAKGQSLAQRASSAVGFHRPFRVTESASGGKPGAIASLFTSRGVSNGFVRSGAHPTVSQSRSQRRRVAPTLNVMVAGARGTGKTSLLKLFLDTSDISSTSTPEQRLSVQNFLSKSRKSTRGLQTACVEIAETRFDRVLLTLIDTPGLNFEEGKELGLERAVSGLVKYLDLQFDETMGEESKVVRQSKGDQHVHLCIYLIDPASITTASARRAKSSLPGGKIARSQTTIAQSQSHKGTSNQHSTSHHDDDSGESDDDALSEDDYVDSHHHSKLSMNPAEIKVIKRLAARVNVLPVIARTDGLTESRLRNVKSVVKRELEEAGVGFGVFSRSTGAQSVPTPTTPETLVPNGKTRFSMSTTVTEGQTTVDGAASDEEERPARTVIRIRPRKSFTGSERERSRSRKRRSTMDASPDRSDGYESEQPPMPDGSSQLNKGRLTRSALEAILPFGLVSPQPRRDKKGGLASPEPGADSSTMDPLLLTPNEDPQTPTSLRSSVPPSAFPSAFQQQPHLVSTGDYELPREFPRGVFVRKYKWGTLDVLDPNHCDFVALRTAVLSTHFRSLKVNTREVLYEKYRTERLLARRATRGYGEEERKRLLEDLGL